MVPGHKNTSRTYNGEGPSKVWSLNEILQYTR